VVHAQVAHLENIIIIKAYARVIIAKQAVILSQVLTCALHVMRDIIKHHRDNQLVMLAQLEKFHKVVRKHVMLV
jgi:hypothetical protein